MSDSFAQYLPNAGFIDAVGTGASFHGGGLYSLHSAHNHHAVSARRGSIDAFSDAELDGDGHSEPSQCNSASSSSMHLPLVEQQQQHPPQGPYHALADFDGYSSSGSHYGTGSSSDGHAYPAPPGSRDGGRFATSFGDLSLSDPAASSSSFMENNPEGNAPFFTGPAMKTSPQDSTPRPVKDMMAVAAAQYEHQQQQQQQQQNADQSSAQSQSNAQSARDREAEMRELRDFWKQYLRTPLTGPSLGQTPKAELLNSQFGMGDASGESNARPGVKRGLSRVASLPSVRTPPEEKPQGVFQMPRAQQQQSRDVPMQTPGGARGSRTEDDLKRYEQAILARQHEVPLKLSIQPKARRGAGEPCGECESERECPATAATATADARDGAAGVRRERAAGDVHGTGADGESGAPQRAAQRCRRDEQRRGAAVATGAGDGALLPELEPHSRASSCGRRGRRRREAELQATPEPDAGERRPEAGGGTVGRRRGGGGFCDGLGGGGGRRWRSCGSRYRWVAEWEWEWDAASPAPAPGVQRGELGVDGAVSKAERADGGEACGEWDGDDQAGGDRGAMTMTWMGLGPARDGKEEDRDENRDLGFGNDGVFRIELTCTRVLSLTGSNTSTTHPALRESGGWR